MNPATSKPSAIPHFAGRILLGALVALFNLKGFLTYVAIHWAPSPRISDALLAFTGFVGRLMSGVAGDDVIFSSRLAHWLVTGFWWYVAALLLAGVLLWKPLNAANGVGGLFTGLLWFPVTCWVGVIAVAVLALCWKIASWTLGAIAWVLHLFEPLAALLGRVFAFILPWMALLVAAAGAVWAVVLLVRNLRGRPLLIAIGATIAFGIVYSFLPAIARIWFESILPVLAKIGAFLGMLIGAVVPVIVTLLLVLFVAVAALMVLGLLCGMLGLLGWLVVDQFRAAWHGGRGRRAMSFSGFAVGTATAMVLMVCIGVPQAGTMLDVAWRESAWLANGFSPAATFQALLPEQAAGALATLLQDATAPIFDSLLLLGLFAVATLGMFRLGRQEAEVPLGEYLRDGKVFASLCGGAIVAPVLVIAAAVLPSQDG